jgi:hypothetical protein
MINSQVTTNNLSAKTILVVMLLFLVALALLSFGIHQVTQNNTLGSDFYTFWVAGRALFLDHTSPYSPDVTLASQLGTYHRPALAQEDQLAFAYPLYSLLAVFPLVWLQYPWAQSIWMALEILALISAVFLSFPKQPWLPFILLVFYPVFFGLVLGNFNILISSILILVYTLLLKNNSSRLLQILAGVCLAWCTIKPQFIWLHLFFLILLALRNRQYIFIASFLGGMILFGSISLILLPNWPFAWLQRVSEYTQYTSSSPVLFNFINIIFPSPGNQILYFIFSAVFLIFTGWIFRQWWLYTWKDHSSQTLYFDSLICAWLGLVIYLLHPHGFPYEQMTFLIGFCIYLGGNFSAHRRLNIILFVLNLLVSWLAFFVGKQYTVIRVHELPVLLFLFWGIYLISSSSLYQKSVRKSNPA